MSGCGPSGPFKFKSADARRSCILRPAPRPATQIRLLVGRLDVSCMCYAEVTRAEIERGCKGESGSGEDGIRAGLMLSADASGNRRRSERWGET
jgi:hypothetical protein